jgi:hypothetical protein
MQFSVHSPKTPVYHPSVSRHFALPFPCPISPSNLEKGYPALVSSTRCWDRTSFPQRLSLRHELPRDEYGHAPSLCSVGFGGGRKSGETKCCFYVEIPLLGGSWWLMASWYPLDDRQEVSWEPRERERMCGCVGYALKSCVGSCSGWKAEAEAEAEAVVKTSTHGKANIATYCLLCKHVNPKHLRDEFKA